MTNEDTFLIEELTNITSRFKFTPSFPGTKSITRVHTSVHAKSVFNIGT